MRRLAIPLALALSLGFACPAAAEEIVAGLSQSSVAITTNYSGSEILIYGAVKRDAPIPQDRPTRVVITVQGPDLPVVVRRKDRTWGIWLNDEKLRTGPVPTFYAISTSAPLEDTLSQAEDLRLGITLPSVLHSVDRATQTFLDALLRLRTREGFYMMQEGAIAFTEETLFSTEVALPAALTEGNYTVRIFLTRNGAVIDEMKRTIWVRKAGLERFLYNAAHEWSLLYGFAALLVAAVAGWAASALFSRLRW